MFPLHFVMLAAVAGSIGALYCNNRKFFVNIKNNIGPVGIHNDYTEVFGVSSQNASSSFKPYDRFSEIITFKKNELCKANNDTYWSCPTLEAAFLSLQLTDSCFFVSDTKLNTNLSIANVTGFTLMGNFTAIICTGSSGITVTNSVDIVFSSITFIRCEQNHTIASYSVEEEEHLLVSSTFYFKNVTLFSFEGVDIEYSQGYNLLLLNPGHGKFNNCNFQYSRGVYIDYYGSNSKEVEEVFFHHTYIQYNQNQDCKMEGCDNESCHNLPIANGGGISLYFRNGSTNKKVTFADSTNIMHNQARCGGGVYIKMEERSHNNMVFFSNTFVIGNTASLSGGGIRINNSGVNNTFEFESTLIESNNATSGGGIYVRLENSSQRSVVSLKKNTNVKTNVATLSGGGMQIINNSENKNLIQIIDSEIVGNQAIIGSNMMVKSASVNLKNVKINNGSTQDIKTDFIGQGAVNVVNGKLKFAGKNFASDNKWSAVVLDFSKIVVEGELTFYRNSGRKGGALVIDGQSTIVLKNNSKLDFNANQADSSGGAIYVIVPGPSMRLWLPSPNKKHCFFQLDSTITTNVTFVNNSAYDLKGHDIFVSTLNTCRSSFEENATDILSSWRGFRFTNSSNSIVTNAVVIEIPQTQLEQPGKNFSLRLLLRDERLQSVDEKVKIKIDENFLGEFFVNKDLVNLTLFGRESTTIFVVIIAASISKRVEMTFPSCSFGYKYNDSQNSCLCDGSVDNIFCNENFIQFKRNKWIYNKSMYPCPENLCRTCSDSENCYFDEKKQCVEGRNQTSILCSECLTDYSVLLTDSSCKVCKGTSRKKLVYLLLVVFVVGMVINLLVILMNNRFFGRYLLPTAFFYITFNQVFTVKNIMPDWSKPAVNIISLLGMHISFELIPEQCFMENMTDFFKVWLHYIFAFLWLISFFAVAIAIHLIKTLNIKVFKHFFARLDIEVYTRSFTVVSAVFYWNVFRVSLQLMLYIKIDGESYSRVWISPGNFYFNPASVQHQVALVLAAFLIIALPVLILCLHRFCHKLDYLCYCYEGLQENRRWTSIFYYAGQATITVLTEVGSKQELPLIAMWKALTILFLLSFLLIIKPYKKMRRNVFHIILLTTLLLLASINNSLKWVPNDQKNIYKELSLILFVFPIIYCIFDAVQRRLNRGVKDCVLPGVSSTEHSN